MSCPHRNPVEELAEEFLQRYRRGERPSLTEYVERHPELGDEIRELFPALVMMEEAGPKSDESAGRAGDVSDRSGRAPERLGDSHSPTGRPRTIGACHDQTNQDVPIPRSDREKDVSGRDRELLRIAHGRGSVTLIWSRNAWCIPLRIAHGRGSVTLVGLSSHTEQPLRIAHGRGSAKRPQLLTTDERRHPDPVGHRARRPVRR
jgi:hypothetical protein